MSKNVSKSKASDTVRVVILITVICAVIVTLVVFFGQGIVSGMGHGGSVADSSSSSSASTNGSAVDISNINIQYAHNICQEEIHRKYQDELKHLSFDARSSRYDEDSKTFKVFYTLDLMSGGKMIRDSWAYCDVSKVTGQIEEIRLKSDSNRLFNMFGH